MILVKNKSLKKKWFRFSHFNIMLVIWIDLGEVYQIIQEIWNINKFHVFLLSNKELKKLLKLKMLKWVINNLDINKSNKLLSDYFLNKKINKKNKTWNRYMKNWIPRISQL